MTRKHKYQAIQKVNYTLSRALRPWHRRLGIISCLFILLLVVTGIAINHSQHLHLSKAFVQQTWLLDYYGIIAPKHIVQFGSDSKPLLITDNRLWLEHEQILEAQRQLISAAYFSNMLIAIDSEQLYLFDREGKILETQNQSTGLPSGLEALAIESIHLLDGPNTQAEPVNYIWLKAATGYFRADENLIDWIPMQPLAPLSWVTPNDLVDVNLVRYARSTNLNWERVMLDVHSGRAFGIYSVWIWDFFALALLLVSFSGLWIWIKQTKPRR
ncbi:PepSY domain-containing protein [Shewanella xiamenensis]|uniref:PepSY domain-containing protein n=1 Tax=Shewanella xiamenensis TaxID=332186 RepID=UPI0024A6D4A2|nr:PepSY domain-containing protein [Shewanella xiamenensis]MDI5847254.1 PepSY domain-containing protein [Shewanella xiamenensis]MEE1979703.1 PepSY domain-containing protein [Shewanella xiamenensis]